MFEEVDAVERRSTMAFPCGTDCGERKWRTGLSLGQLEACGGGGELELSTADVFVD